MLSRNLGTQREFFDMVAPSWRDNNPIGAETVEALLAAIPLKRGARVLDVGCGTGVLDERLLAKGLRVDAVDLSEKMIERARKNPSLRGVSFFAADFYEFGEANEYDFILVFDAYPHFYDKEGFCSQAYRLLKEGGELWIFFDGSKEKINGIHNGHATDISIGLRSAEAEAAVFKGKFDVLHLEDDERAYCIGLKKILKKG